MLSLSSILSSPVGENETKELFLSNTLPQEAFVCNPTEMFNIRFLVSQRALEALQEYKNRKMVKFDGSFGDQACQIRALLFCLYSKEGLKIPFKQTRKAIKLYSDQLLFVQKECQTIFEKYKSKINVIKKTQLKPLSLRNEEINQQREQELENIPKGDPRVRTLNAKYGSLFAAVKKERAPIEKQIALLEKKSLEKQLRKIEVLEDPLVDSTMLFLVRSYFVCLVKDNSVTREAGTFVYHQYTDVKRFQKESGYTSDCSLLLKVIEKAKLAVCQGSILFMQKQAEFLICENKQTLQNLLASPRFIPEKKREELPFFYLTRVVFERALQEEISVILKVRNTASRPFEENSYNYRIFFKPKEGAYQVADPEYEDLEKKVIVIEAISRLASTTLSQSSYVNFLLEENRDLFEIVDLNTAQHNQYTDQKIATTNMFNAILSLDDVEKERVVSLYKKAFQAGFSLSNPKICCIDHVFCDVVKNQMRLGEEK